MPGIKPLALARTSRLGLAALALCLSHPAWAEDTQAIVHTLEWRSSPEDRPLAAVDPSSSDQIGHDDVWQRVRSGFKIDDSKQPNPLVSVHESWFAARPANVNRLAARARPYLYHIVEEVERRDMPMEIALLPMIESAFVSTALSPAAASGIWQFIPSTGSHFGLRQDNWYDGRRDFTAATNAALDYLGKLFIDFGDWQLALAAYNCGEGCIARAIQKNAQLGLPTDYASLSLPNETRQYVPKLLAIRNMIRDAVHHGFAIDALPNEPYFNQVRVHANMDLHSAARLANMSSDEFYALNAAFPRKLIRSDTPVNLLVPVDKADAFQRNLETGSWDSWKPYTAQQGERPADIARRFGISVERLLEHNPIQLTRGKFARAQTILVPVKKRDGGKTETVAASPQVVAPREITATRHIVQPGETLILIARRYGLRVPHLTEVNPTLTRHIKPGQVIQLPLQEAARHDDAPAIRPVSFSPGAQPSEPVAYTVQNGDTLFGIARRFQVGVADIQAWNPALESQSAIRAGQTIVVRQP